MLLVQTRGYPRVWTRNSLTVQCGPGVSFLSPGVDEFRPLRKNKFAPLAEAKAVPQRARFGPCLQQAYERGSVRQPLGLEALGHFCSLPEPYRGFKSHCQRQTRRYSTWKKKDGLKERRSYDARSNNLNKTTHRSQVVFVMICPCLVSPAFWMLPVDMDSLPASQSAALEQMARSKVAGTLISATQLAQLIGKCHRTAFGALVEVWTADAAWKPMSQCPDLLGALQDALLGVAGSLAELITPAAAPDQHPTGTEDPADESPAETPDTSAAHAVAVGARESAREAAVGSRETALGSREATLLARETALGSREATLENREAALGSREAAVRSREVALGAREVTMGTTRVAPAATAAAEPTRTAALERYELEMEERKAEGAAGALVNLGSKRPRRS